MIKYIIFNFSEVNLIDFSEILEDDKSTLRVSSDDISTIVKWDDKETGYIPESISNLSSYEGPFSQSEILEIVKTKKWEE